jgi:D-alanyl-D-alanine dipeptidase
MKKIIFMIIVLTLLVGCKQGNNSKDKNSSVEVSSPETTAEDIITKEYINYKEISEHFEMPINGATGFTSKDLNLREGPSPESAVLVIIEAGSPLTIIEEVEDWWKVEVNNQIGYVYHRYCMINLQDVIPSIIYDNTNSYQSLLRVSEYAIPNITGKKLYNTYLFNKRYQEQQFIVPVLYATAKKIDLIQKAALKDGNTLIIYEAFRPLETQLMMVDNLLDLIQSEPVVKERLTSSGWSLDWFVNTGISNHQLGIAIDVSLGKVENIQTKYIADFQYDDVIDYTEYEMPTKIHDLSLGALTFKQPVLSRSKTEWKNATLSESMNEHSKLLQLYCTDSGFTPLASEWWHFNDLDNYDLMKSIKADGTYYINSLNSKTPKIPK